MQIQGKRQKMKPGGMGVRRYQEKRKLRREEKHETEKEGDGKDSGSRG